MRQCYEQIAIEERCTCSRVSETRETIRQSVGRPLGRRFLQVSAQARPRSKAKEGERLYPEELIQETNCDNSAAPATRLSPITLKNC